MKIPISMFADSDGNPSFEYCDVDASNVTRMLRGISEVKNNYKLSFADDNKQEIFSIQSQLMLDFQCAFYKEDRKNLLKLQFFMQKIRLSEVNIKMERESLDMKLKQALMLVDEHYDN